MKTLHCTGSPMTDTSSQPGDLETGERGGEVKGGDCTYSLEELAYLRSGDKGNTANIGIYRVCTCRSICHWNMQCYTLVTPVFPVPRSDCIG